MSIVFFIIGILSILYFPILCIDSQRFNPTFASFWIVWGVGAFACCFVTKMGGYPSQILILLLTVCFLIFLCVERRILMAIQIRPVKEFDFLIVLGARVNGTKPSAALLKRLDAATRYLNTNPKVKVIVSGGQGPGEFLTEAEAMKKVLLERGISSERIVLENQSTSTQENLMFCERYLNKEEHCVGIVTNDFHVYRSVCLARAMGYQKCYGLPADSEAISLLNYLVREFFAVIKEIIFNHI